MEWSNNQMECTKTFINLTQCRVQMEYIKTFINLTQSRVQMEYMKTFINLTHCRVCLVYTCVYLPKLIYIKTNIKGLKVSGLYRFSEDSASDLDRFSDSSGFMEILNNNV